MTYTSEEPNNDVEDTALGNLHIDKVQSEHMDSIFDTTRTMDSCTTQRVSSKVKEELERLKGILEQDNNILTMEELSDIYVALRELWSK